MVQIYYGTKRVEAWVENRPAPDGDGYGVKYKDGYVSWSPKQVFKSTYFPIDQLSFGHVVEILKAGGKVTRAAWNNKNIFIKLQMPTKDSKMSSPYLYRNQEIRGKIYLVPWVPNIEDILCPDWTVVE